MRYSDEIIKAALLGTDKYSPQVAPALQSQYEAIQAAKSDKETRFWALAATTLLYETAGGLPMPITGVIAEGPTETRPFAADSMTYLMKSSLQSKDDNFFQYLIYWCLKKGEVVRPELVPTLLNTALEQKKIASKLITISGESGKWLCGLHEKWRDLIPSNTPEDVWETGTFAARKQFFAELRLNDPAKAVQALEAVMSTETVENRLELVEILTHKPSLADEPFLVSLLKDKSTKVKQMALHCLKGLEGSAMNRLYLSTLRQLLHINQKKITLVKAIPDEAFFQSGVEKISSEKGVEDHVFYIAQILAYLNPATLGQAYQIPEKDLIEVLYTHPQKRLWLPYLIRATIAFKHQPWAIFLLEREEKINMALLDVLDPNQRNPFLDQLVVQNTNGFVHYIIDDTYTLIPTPLATQMMQQLAKDPYLISQSLYKRIALQLPFEILPILSTIVNDYRDDYQFRYYRTQVEEMCRIINTKERIN